MFSLGEDELELGLGVHGEPGCERAKVSTANEIVSKILKKLVSCKKLELKKGKVRSF